MKTLHPTQIWLPAVQDHTKWGREIIGSKGQSISVNNQRNFKNIQDCEKYPGDTSITRNLHDHPSTWKEDPQSYQGWFTIWLRLKYFQKNKHIHTSSRLSKNLQDTSKHHHGHSNFSIECNDDPKSPQEDPKSVQVKSPQEDPKSVLPSNVTMI